MVDMLSGIPNFLCFRFSHGYFRRLHRIWKITDTIFWTQRVQMHIRMDIKEHSIRGSQQMMVQSSVRTGPLSRMEPVIDVMLRYMSIM